MGTSGPGASDKGVGRGRMGTHVGKSSVRGEVSVRGTGEPWGLYGGCRAPREQEALVWGEGPGRGWGLGGAKGSVGGLGLREGCSGEKRVDEGKGL